MEMRNTEIQNLFSDGKRFIRGVPVLSLSAKKNVMKYCVYDMNNFLTLIGDAFNRGRFPFFRVEWTIQRIYLCFRWTD
jgi:hypothetical protein